MSNSTYSLPYLLTPITTSTPSTSLPPPLPLSLTHTLSISLSLSLTLFFFEDHLIYKKPILDNRNEVLKRVWKRNEENVNQEIKKDNKIKR